MIGNGGVSALPLKWENNKKSGYYAYRSIVNEYQFEVHVIPEFLVFNGCDDDIVVREKGKQDINVDSKSVKALSVDARERGLELALELKGLNCRTQFVRAEELGLRVAILEDTKTGRPIGSICIQTAIDHRGDARLVVKIGDVKVGDGILCHSAKKEAGGRSLFHDDFLRFRVVLTELKVTWNESKNQDKNKAAASAQSSSVAKVNKKNAASVLAMLEEHQQPLASIAFTGFSFDFRRTSTGPLVHGQVSSSTKKTNAGSSVERSQVSVILRNIKVKDLTPNTKYSTIFSSPITTNLIDLSIKIRGPLEADLVKVDSFDFNLSHANGRSEKIELRTSEDFVWKALDAVNRIQDASGDYSSLVLKIEHDDEEQSGYIAKIEEVGLVQQKAAQEKQNQNAYAPPTSDTLYDMRHTRVSPFQLTVSFQRNPHAARYQSTTAGNGSAQSAGAFTTYLLQQLKFTIDQADLKFARFESKSLKGPSDRIIESLAAVYVSRIKFKAITLLSAVSLQDWRNLAGRDAGDDEFVEGDVLRATGNLAGKSAQLLLHKVGHGIGSGVGGITSAVGNTIENTTELIGAGRVGAGMNSVISGIGVGVGDTVTGGK